MAVRLSVVLVQTRPPTTNAQRLTDEVVGELIGLRGIDLTLVDPLATLGPSSTDRLTLGSLSGDLAVLDWQDPQRILADLAAVGVEGERAPHDHDVGPPPLRPGVRRIYLYDLSLFSSARQLVNGLSRLLAQRQVTTFTLAPGTLGGTNLGTANLGTANLGTANLGTGKQSETQPPQKGTGTPSSSGTQKGTGEDSAGGNDGRRQSERQATENSNPVDSPSVGRATELRTDQLPAASAKERVDLESLIDELDQIDP